MGNGNGMTINTKVDINTVIQVLGMIVVAVVFIVTINTRLENINARLEEHKIEKEIHMTVSEGEEYFVRKSELDAIKDQLNRIEKILEKK